MPEQTEIGEQQQQGPPQQEPIPVFALYVPDDLRKLRENARNSQGENRDEHERDEQEAEVIHGR